MAAPAQVTIQPNWMTDFLVEEETPVKVVYKFWVFRAGEGWHPIGPEETDDDKSDHWIFTPPMPSGSKFAYWLGIYGHKNAPWRVRLTIAQRDPAQAGESWTTKGTWTEEGVLNDAGNGGGVASTDVIHVDLT